jgi:hypothetical protein
VKILSLRICFILAWCVGSEQFENYVQGFELHRKERGFPPEGLAQASSAWAFLTMEMVNAPTRSLYMQENQDSARVLAFRAGFLERVRSARYPLETYHNGQWISHTEVNKKKSDQFVASLIDVLDEPEVPDDQLVGIQQNYNSAAVHVVPSMMQQFNVVKAHAKVINDDVKKRRFEEEKKTWDCEKVSEKNNILSKFRTSYSRGHNWLFSSFLSSWMF